MNTKDSLDESYTNTSMHDFFLIQDIRKGTENLPDTNYLKNYDGILGLSPLSDPNVRHSNFPSYLKKRGLIDKY